MNNDLYVIRHCETGLNIENKISGGADIPITNFVVDLKCFSEDRHTLIITSPLLRCIQTCELIQKKIVIKDIIKDSRLVERDMGMLDGMEKNKAIRLYPNLFNSKGRFNPYEMPPSGESYENFLERVKNFYCDLKEYMIESDVIVVSHNQTLKMLYSIIYQVRLEDIWNSMNFQNGELVKFCFN